jgi:hypothetical protein
MLLMRNTTRIWFPIHILVPKSHNPQCPREHGNPTDPHARGCNFPCLSIQVGFFSGTGMGGPKKPQGCPCRSVPLHSGANFAAGNDNACVLKDRFVCGPSLHLSHPIRFLGISAHCHLCLPAGLCVVEFHLTHLRPQPHLCQLLFHPEPPLSTAPLSPLPHLSPCQLAQRQCSLMDIYRYLTGMLSWLSPAYPILLYITIEKFISISKASVALHHHRWLGSSQAGSILSPILPTLRAPLMSTFSPGHTNSLHAPTDSPRYCNNTTYYVAHP